MSSDAIWMSPNYVQTDLYTRFGIDVVSAAATAFIVSPVVTLIDSTIVRKAAHGGSFGANLNKTLKPISRIPYNLLLSRPSRLVWAVYAGTYLTANCFDTFLTRHDPNPSDIPVPSMTKFTATAIISTGLTVYKDSRLAQIFAKSGSALPVPLVSYSLFTLRDAITIYACFELPPRLAPMLSGMIETESRQVKAAQFLLPAAIQFITTPIHLCGFDLHNRRGALGVKARAERVGRDLSTAIPARMVRILPAFGVGGVFNISARSWLRERVIKR